MFAKQVAISIGSSLQVDFPVPFICDLHDRKSWQFSNVAQVRRLVMQQWHCCNFLSEISQKNVKTVTGGECPVVEFWKNRAGNHQIITWQVNKENQMFQPQFVVYVWGVLSPTLNLAALTPSRSAASCERCDSKLSMWSNSRKALPGNQITRHAGCDTWRAFDYFGVRQIIKQYSQGHRFLCLLGTIRSVGAEIRSPGRLRRLSIKHSGKSEIFRSCTWKILRTCQMGVTLQGCMTRSKPWIHLWQTATWIRYSLTEH